MLLSFRRPARLLAGACLALAACTKPTPAPTTGQADTVTGVALDTNGQPIAGAKVRAENNVTRSFVETRTDAAGRYSLPGVLLGGWNIYAWKETTYKGQPYVLRLGMPTAADYNPFAPGSQGIVRNFQWQLSGEIPDRTRSGSSGAGYFGGTLRFVNLDSNFSSLPDGTTVTVTLTPVAGATRFDGSVPQAVQKSFVTTTTSPAQYSYYLQDIPQGEYRITAARTFQGSTRALLLSSSLSTPYTAAIASYYFKSAGSTGSYESGLASPQNEPVYMQP